MDFEEQLTVVRVRKRYAAPFLKYKYIYLDKKDIKSKKVFCEKINRISKSWPDSEYQLKFNSGKVFIRFTIKEGAVTKVYTKSNITGNDYVSVKFMKDSD